MTIFLLDNISGIPELERLHDLLEREKPAYYLVQYGREGERVGLLHDHFAGYDITWQFQ